MAQEYKTKIAKQYEDALRLTHKRFSKKTLIGRAIRALLPTSIIEVNSCKFELHPRDNHTEYQMFMQRRPSEPETLDYIIQRCRGKRIHFIDIGANCGAFSVPIACASDHHSTIMAFEPNPIMLKRLTRNIQLNDVHNVTVYPFALGPQESCMTLRFPPGRLGNYGGGSLVMHSKKSQSEVEVKVKVLTPDLVLASGDYDVRALKIDVEGFEDRALYGYITKVLDDILPDMIVIETDHQHIWQFDLLAAFAARGYSAKLKLDGNQIYERER